ncbi:uncharacterized protein ACBR49_008520 [Aulostomus maculatus]
MVLMLGSRWHCTQTAALRRLAQIESRISNRKQIQQAKPVPGLSSHLAVSAIVNSQSREAPVSPPSRSSSGREKHFLKSKRAAAESAGDLDVGVRLRTADESSVNLRTKSASARISVSSDEEDMRKLLGDPPDGRSAPRTANKIPSRSTQRVQTTPPTTAVHPSGSQNPAPPGSPAPSVVCSSLCPVSLSPGSSPRSTPSMSGHQKVLSLDELFLVGPGSDVPLSETDPDSSEFDVRIKTVDQLGFTEGPTAVGGTPF